MSSLANSANRTPGQKKCLEKRSIHSDILVRKGENGHRAMTEEKRQEKPGQLTTQPPSILLPKAPPTPSCLVAIPNATFTFPETDFLLEPTHVALAFL